MDWIEIKDTKPKAFRKMQDYFSAHEMAYGDTPCQSWSDQYGRINGRVNARDLYDFFDSKGIIVIPQYDKKTETWGWISKSEWSEDIKGSGNVGHLGYKQRMSAEIVAFVNAFEVLEKTL